MREGEHVEAVVEVFAEAAGGDFFAQAAVGGGEHAHVERDGHAAAEALDFAFLQHAQQLRLQASGISVISSSSSVPPCACSNLPACVVCAPVKAPRS